MLQAFLKKDLFDHFNLSNLSFVNEVLVFYYFLLMHFKVVSFSTTTGEDSFFCLKQQQNTSI